MGKYTDEEIRNLPKITCKIATDYLGIALMAVSIGMRNDRLPIGFKFIMRIETPKAGVITLLMNGSRANRETSVHNPVGKVRDIFRIWKFKSTP